VPGPTVDPDVLMLVAGAIRSGERVRFDYTAHGGAVTRRDVEPHRLVAWHGRWYLVAWDPGRDGWRTFRLDRCRPVRSALGPRFRPRELGEADAATFVRRGADRAVWRVRARIRFHVPASVARARLPPAVTVSPDPDRPDSCVAEVGSDSPHQLALWVGLLDTDFDVLDPPELRDALARLAARYTRAAAAAR
jgi:predicted DNA-binding transcriptional regulator YafY